MSDIQIINTDSNNSLTTAIDNLDSNEDIREISAATSSTNLINWGTVSLAWENLSYSIKNRKIVENASGVVKPGECMAILGPSGAGKSTLLDLLAGRKDHKNVSGQIYLNGRPGQIKYVSTYVMQEDAIMEVLTVRENIQFAADLCFPASYSDAERRTRVQDIITEFGLDRVADSKIGSMFIRGVSGGEKRRASIATQVITLPKIIFLDEPTTGLDSAASYNVMKAILQMTQKHKLTVIASIHQPSTETYSLFDKLCILGRGRTLYLGGREEAIRYFENLGHKVPNNSNPADHFLDLINSDFLTDKADAEKYLSEFVNGFEGSEAYEVMKSEINNLIEKHKGDRDTRKISSKTTERYQQSFMRQTYILIIRCFKNALRNILLFWSRVILYVCLGLLMGTAWWKVGFHQTSIFERLTTLYFSIAFLSFMSTAGIPGFLEERYLFQRERANRFYSVGPYVLANTLVSIPFICIITISFACVMYPTVELHSGFDRVAIFTGILFLSLLAAESMVVLIASIFPQFISALCMAAFFNGFWMMSAGYIVRPPDIPAGWKWAHYMDYQKYAYEAIIYNDLSGLTFNCEKLSNETGGGIKQYNCYYGDKSGSSAQFSGEDVLRDLGYDSVKIWLWAIMLVVIMIVCRILFYIILRVRRAPS
ncbi:8602_t:CDS:2 [Ambispora gerdemannii]|uniref:8602_t:CDS:1 n=1 Tax=Ambispora gerdemannii TaxID=144530 RepID=A0A9N8UYJ4_9GLOM|nr:8602_t:CDS:2 [Ambispora gerdemannii]